MTLEETIHCNKAGIQKYMTKPVSLDQLDNGIATARTRYHSPGQEARRRDALLPIKDAAMRHKICHSLHLLLCKLEHNLGHRPATYPKSVSRPGVGEPSGLQRHRYKESCAALAAEEITKLRHTLNLALDA